MKCEMSLCIYQEGGECHVDEIEINSLGMCEACIIIDVDEKYLANKKAKMLADFAARHAEWDRQDRQRKE